MSYHHLPNGGMQPCAPRVRQDRARRSRRHDQEQAGAAVELVAARGKFISRRKWRSL